MGKSDEAVGALIGVAAAVGLGLLGAAVIGALFKPKCPNCGTIVNRNEPYCNSCHTILRWH